MVLSGLLMVAWLVAMLAHVWFVMAGGGRSVQCCGGGRGVCLVSRRRAFAGGGGQTDPPVFRFFWDATADWWFVLGQNGGGLEDYVVQFFPLFT